MPSATNLEGWFIHYELVLKLLGQDAAIALTQWLPRPESPFADAHTRHAFETALAEYLERPSVTALAVACVDGSLRNGQLVWLDQALIFKGVAAARPDEGKRATFSGVLDVDNAVRVSGDFNTARVTSLTAAGMLSGRARQFVLGYVQKAESSSVVLRPIFIGQRLLPVEGEGYELEPREFAHVWPQQLDQFRGVDFTTRLTRQDLKILKEVPETQVKHWFAAIIGEPEVPEDWGGEQFDLWTTRLSVEGEPLRAAIAFKGPGGGFHPMRIADLGKNGDQIDRLAATAADLLVVQHGHSITAPVVNMLRHYATPTDRIRRYMTIDGYDTIRILQHFGYLNGEDSGNA